MRAIAQEAGVGIATLYRHFPPRGNWSTRSTATKSRGSATGSPPRTACSTHCSP
ncbi:helix-turn-helix domain-containing protein [Actinoplanes sp. NPDC051633]|uniref:TetR/AcrR family transcriptional regulator n=1 Tax=Actinoplanes sp. NPDC051633 TaxID=3155670 RepID=UPI0034146427